MKKGVLVVASTLISIILGCSTFYAGDRMTSINKLVQAGLTNEGYDCGVPDGIIGSNTQSQIDAFCHDNNIEFSTTEALLPYLFKGESEAQTVEEECHHIGEHLTQEYNSFLQQNKFYYNDLLISDSEILELGGKYAVNQGAIFRIMTRRNSTFYEDSTYYANKKDFTRIYGKEWLDTAAERIPVIEKAQVLLTVDDSCEHLFQALSESPAVYGTFDYSSRSFDFVIPDLDEFAESFGITNEMVGYTLAALTEYTSNYEFFGNAVYMFTD